MIKRIRIRNFKSIRDLNLELDPVTVLVGRSGTGKSNIVQAIRFLRNLLLDFNGAVDFEFGWDRIVPVGMSRPSTLIEVWFTVPSDDREFNYCVGFGVRASERYPCAIHLTEERLSLGTELLFSRTRKLENWRWEWIKAPKSSVSPEHSDAPMIGQLPSIQEIVFANAALSTGVGYYHFPASAMTMAPGRQHGSQLLEKVPGLDDVATNYRHVLRGITQDFHHPDIRKNLLASLQALNPSVASVELDSLTAPQKAIVGHQAGEHVFALSLEQESDGFRRFYAHLLALYQTPSKIALVFEEPENAIFPGALALLADEFKAAPRENRGQVILTTHSPILLDAFDVDNVRAVEMQNGITVAGRVSKEQCRAVQDKLLSTGDLLTVERPRIEEEPALTQTA